MKKIISVIIAAVLAAGCLSACGTNEPSPDETEAAQNGDKLSIVATIFPEYDWVKQIVGDNDADVKLLLNNGVDLHSYQPTAEDMLKIANSDVFIYVGGESDEWVEDALEGAENRDMTVLNLLSVLGDTIKKEEVKEGMEAEDDDSEEDAGYDEHVWLSLKNASVLCAAIADALCEADSVNAEDYKSNADSYIEKINALDSRYQSVIDQSPVKTLIFGDRFPFRYMTDDYGLDYYAAFAGCSAETEASFETILFLANKIDELGLKNIMQTESSDGKIAETIRQSTQSKSQQILTLDSMQSTASDDISNGASYLGIMEKNLNVLKAALE